MVTIINYLDVENQQKATLCNVMDRLGNIYQGYIEYKTAPSPHYNVYKEQQLSPIKHFMGVGLVAQVFDPAAIVPIG